MTWTAATIARLRELWTEGLSTAEIGRRIGASKNAVVGKSRRLHLPARPSPIATSGAIPRSHRPQPRVDGPTLPPLASAPVSATVAPAPRYGRSVPCCWPFGDPGTRAFRFCTAPSAPGRPYCREHVGVAYAVVRREEAA